MPPTATLQSAVVEDATANPTPPASWAPEPWTGNLEWHDACRPNYDLFTSEATAAQRALMAAEGLTFDDDDDDYTVRHTLLPALQRLLDEAEDDEDDEGDDTEDADTAVNAESGNDAAGTEETTSTLEQLDQLVDLVGSTLCHESCTDCAENEQEWLYEQLYDAVTEFDTAHADQTVNWVVLDWRGDAISIGSDPDCAEMTTRYFRSFNGYSSVQISLHTANAFAEVSFDRMTFTVHAFTDETDLALIDHAQDKSGYTETDLAPLLESSRPKRELMMELVTMHGDHELPERLTFAYSNDKAPEPHRVYGIVEDADLAVLSALAGPLLGRSDDTKAAAFMLLPTCDGNWGDLVAAVAAATGDTGDTDALDTFSLAA